MSSTSLDDKKQLWLKGRVRGVSEDQWVIGEALITRHKHKPPQPCWEDDQGSYFTMADGTGKKTTERVSDSCPITDFTGKYVGEQGLYRIGNAFLHKSLNRGAQEHNTLRALKERSYDFEVPTEYCHAVYGDTYYIVYSVLPGKSLIEVWPTTKDDDLKRKWTLQIAEAYLQRSEWHNDRICGIDGGNLTHYMTVRESGGNPNSFTHEALLKNFESIGLDCSEFVFAHNHISPLPFMVDESEGKGLVGIFMWHDAGFVPKDWVHTITRSNPFTQTVSMLEHYQWTGDVDEGDWDYFIEIAMEEKGFREFWENYATWLGNRPK